VIGRELPARTPEEVARLVRALGSHRYVAGRLLLVHAFVYDALEGTLAPDLDEGRAWAKGVLSSSDVDPSSRDERLHRRATERELGAALAALWGDDDAAARAKDRLAARLEAAGAELSPALFDEASEDDVFPVLIDAGWELLPLSQLDPERHKGAIDAFGDPAAFERAKDSERAAALPALHELPVVGPAELLHGAEHAILRAPLVLWTEGDATYHDYVVRGVLRAAKLD
jgi:hypothetical protein